MRLQQTSEVVPAKIRISQAVWQRVPKRWAGPLTECATTALGNHQKTDDDDDDAILSTEVAATIL